MSPPQQETPKIYIPNLQGLQILQITPFPEDADDESDTELDCPETITPSTSQKMRSEEQVWKSPTRRNGRTEIMLFMGMGKRSMGYEESDEMKREGNDMLLIGVDKKAWATPQPQNDASDEHEDGSDGKRHANRDFEAANMMLLCSECMSAGPRMEKISSRRK
ncbi:hypothetical protein FKW77_002832 [Venturia effusa]|uniref:Uncharacterized protein n=1 Tax=Venturia effusa TaxID=50376 RepID=A0A517L6X7_9PEZI|nr:hypothetical protein FKW77_002832 [Venturia effusa]